MQVQPYASLILVSTDYANTTADLTFGPHDRSQCVLIPLINDMVPENQEQFKVKLAMITPLPGIVLTPDTATIVINDDDGESDCDLQQNKLTTACIHFGCSTLSPGSNPICCLLQV